MKIALHKRGKNKTKNYRKRSLKNNNNPLTNRIVLKTSQSFSIFDDSVNLILDYV